MPWVIGVYCCATATAVELSDSTLAASARLIGAAMLAFTRDIASRSGSSTACASIWARLISRCSNSSPQSGQESCTRRWSCAHPSPAMLDALSDGCDLLGARDRRRVVGQDVQRGSQVDRR